MSAAPTIYTPRGVPFRGGDIIAKKQSAVRKRLKQIEAFGRKIGQPAGSYMDDLSSQWKTIWLCWECRHKFNYKGAHYFYEKNIRVTGRCDGCRELRPDSHLFIHESRICDFGGKIRHEHVWTPRKGG